MIGGDDMLPVMFYNGATRAAEWRIGWIVFDRLFTQVERAVRNRWCYQGSGASRRILISRSRHQRSLPVNSVTGSDR